jgi:hypothetical protein
LLDKVGDEDAILVTLEFEAVVADSDIVVNNQSVTGCKINGSRSSVFASSVWNCKASFSHHQ